MEFRRLDIEGLIEIVPVRLGDERGYFAETFRKDRFAAAAGAVDFVQQNQSLSAKRGTIRGLHYQSSPRAQGKLVSCIAGAIFDVAVDLRTGSPTFGAWEAVTLSAQRGNQLWIPAGFAHGFCTIEPDSIVSYKVTDYYSAPHDMGVAWDDPAIGIRWPDEADPATLSAKDMKQPRLGDLSVEFVFEGAACG